MSVPPPGPLLDEAAKFAEALLGKVRGADLPPDLVARFGTAVADVAVAGAGLLRVVAEMASAWGETARPSDAATNGADAGATNDADAGANDADAGATGAADARPRVERIDIG